MREVVLGLLVACAVCAPPMPRQDALSEVNYAQFPSDTLGGESASASPIPSVSPSPSSRPVLVGGSIMLEMEVEEFTPTDFHKHASEFRTLLQSLIRDKNVAQLGVSVPLADIQLVMPDVLIVKLQARNEFGGLVETPPLYTGPEIKRSPVVVTVAIPIISDSLMDANFVAQNLVPAFVDGSFSSAFKASVLELEKTPIFRLSRTPHWDSFENTQLISRVSMDVTLSGNHALQLNPGSGSDLETGLLAVIASSLRVPAAWASFGEEHAFNKESGEVIVVANIDLEIDKSFAEIEETKALLRNGTALADTIREIQLKELDSPVFKLDGGEQPLQIKFQNIKSEMLLQPATKSGPRSVFVTGTLESPRKVTIRVPFSSIDGSVRGVQLPLDMLSPLPVYEVVINVIRPVEITLDHTRSSESLRDLYTVPQ
eukprot:c18681_g1_i1.p1 GENE.c18681_g1_i1~~c18681_g1_i1.p1  ORF type:complete len:439 (-),score=107.84 c18681_g1_i1:89-1372(-)